MGRPDDRELIREAAEKVAGAICADGRSTAAEEEIANLLVEFANEIKRQVTLTA